MIKFLPLFLFIFFLVGCSNEKNDEIIKFGIAQKPQNLDPSIAADASSERLNHLIYSYLFHYDKSFQIKSDFVKWRNINKKSFLFTIKKNLPFFTNNKQVDIYDIVASIKYLKDLKTSRYSNELSIINEIDIISDSQFQLNLNKHDPNFLNRLEIPIFSKDLLNKKHNFSLKPIGSGSFSFLLEEGKIKLKRRSDNQVIEFIEIKDPTVRALKLIRKEIDIIQNDLPLATVNFLKEQPNIFVNQNFGSNISYLGFNFKNKFLKISEIREAIEMAIDKKTLIKYFFNEKTRQANQLFSTEHWVHENLEFKKFDPLKAKAIIKKYNNGKPIKIVYKTSTDPFRIKIATIIQNQLSKIGVKLIIKSMDWGTYFKDIRAGNFDMYSLTWVGIKNPNIYEKIFFSTNTPPIGLNRGYYQNSKLDQLIIESFFLNMWSKTIRLVSDDVAFIPLWFEGNIAAYTDKISSYNLQLDGNWSSLENIQRN